MTEMEIKPSIRTRRYRPPSTCRKRSDASMDACMASSSTSAPFDLSSVPLQSFTVCYTVRSPACPPLHDFYANFHSITSSHSPTSFTFLTNSLPSSNNFSVETT